MSLKCLCTVYNMLREKTRKLLIEYRECYLEVILRLLKNASFLYNINKELDMECCSIKNFESRRLCVKIEQMSVKVNLYLYFYFKI